MGPVAYLGFTSILVILANLQTTEGFRAKTQVNRDYRVFAPLQFLSSTHAVL